MVVLMVVVVMAVRSRPTVAWQERCAALTLFVFVFVFHCDFDGEPSGQRYGRVALELGRARWRWPCKRRGIAIASVRLSCRQLVQYLERACCIFLVATQLGSQSLLDERLERGRHARAGGGWGSGAGVWTQKRK